MSAPPFEELLRFAANADLERAARELRRLAVTREWTQRAAGAGEELLHPLARAGDDGPALYLVSDGAGVVSPPHGHDTWAIIAGIRGIEVNVLYTKDGDSLRVVAAGGERRIGPGDVLVLEETAIHATSVIGDATYHLHLYGRPLEKLRPFAERTFNL